MNNWKSKYNGLLGHNEGHAFIVESDKSEINVDVWGHHTTRELTRRISNNIATSMNLFEKGYNLDSYIDVLSCLKEFCEVSSASDGSFMASASELMRMHKKANLILKLSKFG